MERFDLKRGLFVKYIPIELDDESIAELKDPSIDPSDLDFAVVHVNYAVRSFAARNPSLTPQHISWLLSDYRGDVLAGLAENPALDSATLLSHLEKLDPRA